VGSDVTQLIIPTEARFGSEISISAILKIAFIKIVFLKSSLFKISHAFGKTG
jgi:hypothetical protein